MNLKTALLILSTTAGLAACGGGSDDSYSTTVAPATNTVPSSAKASTSAFRQYVASLTASETAEPVDVTTLDLAPTSETETATAL